MTIKAKIVLALRDRLEAVRREPAAATRPGAARRTPQELASALTGGSGSVPALLAPQRVLGRPGTVRRAVLVRRTAPPSPEKQSAQTRGHFGLRGTRLAPQGYPPRARRGSSGGCWRQRARQAQAERACPVSWFGGPLLHEQGGGVPKGSGPLVSALGEPQRTRSPAGTNARRASVTSELLSSRRRRAWPSWTSGRDGSTPAGWTRRRCRPARGRRRGRRRWRVACNPPHCTTGEPPGTEVATLPNQGGRHDFYRDEGID
jgi:hypothetical protein